MRLTAGGRGGALAPALVMPYPALELAGLRLRQGQCSLWVAAPGVGKSQLLSNIAVRSRQPAIYWSADTDQFTVTVRVLALLTGNTTNEVEQQMLDPTWTDYHRSKLESTGNVSWVFDSTIKGQVIAERMRAFAEVQGAYPKLLVVDNLSNTVESSSDEYAELREVVRALQNLARESKAHVAMLHHAKGEYENGTKPIPQGGALGNLAKLPEQMITLYHAGESRLGVCIVKNRGGRADPSAKTPLFFDTDYSRATVRGFQEVAA